jgi:hypothetical protein
MKNRFKFIASVALSLLFQFNLKAQLVVNTTTYVNPDPATRLVNNVLLGTVVTASTIVFTPAVNSSLQLG